MAWATATLAPESRSVKVVRIAPHSVGNELIQLVSWVSQGKGNSQRKLPFGCVGGISPFTPELAFGNDIEARHLAVLGLDEAQEIGLVATVPILRLQMDDAFETAFH